MLIQPKGLLKENVQEVELYFIGDVRDVIYSRAERVRAVPALFHGLGACGTDDPVTTGESIIFRGYAARTPPDSDAGTKIDYHTTARGFYTPFFLGWNGRPSLTTEFISDAGVTLNQLYQSIFSYLAESGFPPNFEYVFLELVGLFKPDDISDRALQKPINQGNVLTTSAEHANTFFKPRIIYNDLVERKASLAELFPLCVVGAGHLRDVSDPNGKSLSERIFYRPPQIDANASTSTTADGDSARVLTHNHALGWRGESSFVGRLLSALQSRSHAGDEAPANDGGMLDGLLARRPDYLVHLDDWSVVTAATVNIYLAPANCFQLQPT